MTPESIITIESPATEAHEEANQAIVAEAKAIVITDAEQHAAAQEFLTRVAGMSKQVRELFRESKAAAHQAHRSVCSLESSLLQPLSRASENVRGKVLSYEQAERRRAEEEAQRKAEEARRAEEERRLADAEQAEAEGDHETAEAILEEAPVVPITVAPTPKVAKVAGVSRRVRWVAEVDDLLALVNYVAENPEWLHLLAPDMAALNGLARSQKDRMRIPGVKVRADESLAVGGGR